MNSDAFKDRLKVVIGDESNRSFADKCDLSEGTVRRYLRGDAFPPLDTLEKIANVGGCYLAWLASGEGPMRRDEAAYPLAEGVKNGDVTGERAEEFEPQSKKADRSPVKAAAVSYIDQMSDIDVSRVITFIVEQQTDKQPVEPMQPAQPVEPMQPVQTVDPDEIFINLSPEGKKELREILEARIKAYEMRNNSQDLKLTGT